MNLSRLYTKIVTKHQKIRRRHTKAGLDPHLEIKPPSSHSLGIAKKIRGNEIKPSIHLHGILPRSGSNYVGELLKLHPEIQAYPNNIYEFPYLEAVGELTSFSDRFFNSYKRNKTQMGENDFLPIFGASTLSYLHGYVSANKRLLVKVPDVQFLNHFFTVFPDENLLILTRDGRDLVQSTIKSWPGRDFSDVCQLWNASAKMILNYGKRHQNNANRFLVVRFEDAVHKPLNTAEKICMHFELDFGEYPRDYINNLPVKGSSELKKDGKMTWEAIEKPKKFNPVGRWKGWPEKWKKQFKKICGETMIEMGYCENLDW